MECVQLRIPPLPQFLTVGHSEWAAGNQHFRRNFSVYDLLIVVKGTLYMTENEIPYTIEAGQLLLLEPGMTHVGHLPCRETTEIYWVHFTHHTPPLRLDEGQINWSERVKASSDHDQQPEQQFLYLPKYGQTDVHALLPLLRDMLTLRQTLTMGRAVDMQVLLGRLLSQLQAGLLAERNGSRTQDIAEKVMAYIRAHIDEPFHAGKMAEALHFDQDYAARCLRKHAGISPIQYHHMMRIEEAKKLLLGTKLTLKEVASAIGYEDYNYFIRMFRRRVGIPPGAFRRTSSGYM